MVKNNQKEIDWIDHYGFILVAYAHMTDWYLADSELQVISEKMEFMLSSTNQPWTAMRTVMSTAAKVLLT